GNAGRAPTRSSTATSCARRGSTTGSSRGCWRSSTFPHDGRSQAARSRARPMSYDTVVIGAGLAGLTAALRLAEQGQRVLVVAKGVGGTHLAPAAIDVLGYVDGPVESPAQALPRFAAAHPEHPYRRLSVELIRSSLGWLRDRLGELGYQGRLEENFLLPTA